MAGGFGLFAEVAATAGYRTGTVRADAHCCEERPAILAQPELSRVKCACWLGDRCATAAGRSDLPISLRTGSTSHRGGSPHCCGVQGATMNRL